MGNLVFGYVRVSTKEQNTDRQITAMKEYAESHGIEIERIFEDKASGKNFDRPHYQSMKLALRSGDTLVVKELDRLGRNMEQIKNEWQELQKRGIDIIVIDNEILNTANKNDLEKVLISNIVFELLAYMAEKERVKIRGRQAEGIAIAKQKGKYTGRKPIVREDFPDVYDRWKAGYITGVEATEALNVSKSTFYRMVRDYEREVK